LASFCLSALIFSSTVPIVDSFPLSVFIASTCI
jgi:hypothetical protein